MEILEAVGGRLLLLYPPDITRFARPTHAYMHQTIKESPLGMASLRPRRVSLEWIGGR